MHDITGRGNNLVAAETPRWEVVRWLSVCGNGEHMDPSRLEAASWLPLLLCSSQTGLPLAALRLCSSCAAI